MFVVGLTGGIGAGKSEACRVFAQLEVPVVDVDVISHLLTAVNHPVLAEIFATLGHQFRQADGSLNRAMLRDTIFQDPQAKAKLEGILHPAIFNQASFALQQNQDSPYQVLAVPLLFESERYRSIVDLSLVIDCPETKQIERVMQRSQMSESQVQAIIAQQISRKERLAQADEVIVNDGNLEHLKQKISDFHKKTLIYLHS